MEKPQELINREKRLSAVAKSEDNGYWSLTGNGPYSLLAYVCLPDGHPDIGKDEMDFGEEDNWGPDVNGGLTFSDGPVFGWDYGHFENDLDVNSHIRNAIKYFKKRA